MQKGENMQTAPQSGFEPRTFCCKKAMLMTTYLHTFFFFLQYFIHKHKQENKEQIIGGKMLTKASQCKISPVQKNINTTQLPKTTPETVIYPAISIMVS